MSLFQEAANLNESGIIALLKGDQKSAIQFMGKAIKLMKTEFSQIFISDNLTNGDDISVSSSALSQSTTQTIEIPQMEACDSIVFNQAVRIPASDVLHLSAFDMNIYTCVVIYNLALAYHFEATLLSGKDAATAAACLEKAEKLYSMVLKLLDQSSLNVHIALVVKLASMNNLSQIRYSKGDYKNVMEGFGQISGFIRESGNQGMLEAPEIQSLLMNVLLLKEPKLAAAA